MHILRLTETCDVLLQMHREHMKWMLGKDIMGRIYISAQGINAQYSGLREHAIAYAKWVCFSLSNYSNQQETMRVQGSKEETRILVDV